MKIASFALSDVGLSPIPPRHTQPVRGEPKGSFTLLFLWTSTPLPQPSTWRGRQRGGDMIRQAITPVPLDSSFLDSARA